MSCAFGTLMVPLQVIRASIMQICCASPTSEASINHLRRLKGMLKNFNLCPKPKQVLRARSPDLDSAT